ncbi:LOW QUALITY PROTEIN: hypothetical protein Cgig2_001933 [Carnegiea gigantea]|uniref:Uncharacterized protein n=1 Tax=Carnegiea gigantea TaxID=171969 RepID=A0A9Q1JXJ7_9CARY|nr:LOW QUALITY PROTEIN: hypothetical protein Cgig2_001933 [Carnegiea gigantea]
MKRLTKAGTLSTLRNIEACSGQEEVVLEPIPRLPATRLLLLFSGPCIESITSGINKIVGRPLLLFGQLSKGIPDRLIFIPTRKVPQPESRWKRRSHISNSLLLISFQWPSSWPVVKAIPPKVLGFLGSSLDGMNQAKRLSGTSKAVQLIGRYKRTNVMLRCGHNLRGCKLQLRQKLHDHLVERKPYAIVKGHSIDRDTFWGRLIDCGIYHRNNKVISRGQEILLLKSRSF